MILFTWHVLREMLKKIALTQAIPRKSPNAGCCLVYLSQVLLAKGYVRGHCHDTIRIGLFFFSFSFKNQGKKKTWSAVPQCSFSLIPDRQRTAFPLTKINKVAGKLHCCSGNTQCLASWHSHFNQLKTYDLPQAVSKELVLMCLLWSKRVRNAMGHSCKTNRKGKANWIDKAFQPVFNFTWASLKMSLEPTTKIC